MDNQEMKHVFIIGSKGIPARYGGYETFVDKLTEYSVSDCITYHVACASEREEYEKEAKEFEYHKAHCFKIKWKKAGSARAVFYDIEALQWSLKYIRENNIQNPVIYILACRIGPFIGYFKRKIKKQGGTLYVNPDGHEWKRAKWSMPVRKYWKISEKLMVKHADLIICDSKNIEKYILEVYKKYNPNTTFIAYGAEIEKSILSDKDNKLCKWYGEHRLQKGEYYLVVGRFVPENNYETMIKEFMKSKTSKSFVLVTNVSAEFLNELKERTGFDRDKRIKFVGTVYDKQLIKKIRENAYGYLHGHEVGGTNPSLLEALGSTRLNLLLDVEFNREVAEDGALYWTKENGSLASLIEDAEKMEEKKVVCLSEQARARIKKYYTWEYIVQQYEIQFLANEEKIL